ncbi:CoA ester lyase [bacterium SGD-2]|nr:CoA ester lyase [bacterium SGD-2]
MTLQPVLRTALFVPGSRADRYAKALAAGADAVIIDLEDAVEPAAKASAREQIRHFAAAHPDAPFMVRCNAVESEWFDADMALCRDLPNITTVVLPKTERADQVERVRQACGKPVLPIIESACGVLGLESIAAAEGTSRLAFGYLDLMLDTGTRPETPGARVMLDHVRCRMILASAAAGILAPLDGAQPDFRNTEALANTAALIRDMGFAGAMCIHPAQVAVVHAAFAPSEAERDWARRVVAEFERTGAAAFQVDGRMVDAPVIERARRILAVPA